MNLLPPDITIEPAQPPQCALIAAIDEASFRTPWSTRDFSVMFGDASYILAFARIGTQPAGYACCRVIAAECEVYRCAVLPAHRRNGIGRRLMDFCMIQARQAGATHAHLEVRGTNHAAAALYEKIGFIAIHRRRGYYDDTGEDAVCMTLTLTS